MNIKSENSIWLFIIYFSIAIINNIVNIITKANVGKIDILAIIALPLCIGLIYGFIKRSPGWRTFSFLWFSIQIALISIMLLAFVFNNFIKGQAGFAITSPLIHSGSAGNLGPAQFWTFVWLLVLWGLHIYLIILLRTPKIKTLFLPGKN